MGASEKLAEKLEPLGQSLLPPGEELLGALAATEVKAFGGGVRAVFVTPLRVIIQPVDRRWNAKGEPISIRPEDIESFRVSGLGDDWITAISVVADSGFELRLKLISGQKIKLMAMSGEGRLLGPLGGGQAQQTGAEALLTWLGELG
ncbi:MAG: hypothetical protein JHC98_04830 [Thermoleophilaceae bacterium]|nr:hypothetical protein [Thermoleophilaceae bacterium]